MSGCGRRQESYAPVRRDQRYCRLARWRTRDPAERARALQVPKPPPVPDGQVSLFDDLPA
jgi:hypothetical protein